MLERRDAAVRRVKRLGLGAVGGARVALGVLLDRADHVLEVGARRRAHRRVGQAVRIDAARLDRRNRAAGRQVRRAAAAARRVAVPRAKAVRAAVVERLGALGGQNRVSCESKSLEKTKTNAKDRNRNNSNFRYE